jgi:hypothetical protein
MEKSPSLQCLPLVKLSLKPAKKEGRGHDLQGQSFTIQSRKTVRNKSESKTLSNRVTMGINVNQKIYRKTPSKQ